MNQKFKNILIAFFTFIGGLYFFLEFMLPKSIDIFGVTDFKFGHYHDDISRGVQVIGIMAIGLGVINIIRVHGDRVIKNKSGSTNSIALILGLFAMLVIEGIDLVQSERRLQPRRQLDAIVLFVAKIDSEYKAEHEVVTAKTVTEINDTAIRNIDALVSALNSLKENVDTGSGYLNTKFQNESDTKAGDVVVSTLSNAIVKGDALKEAYLQDPPISKEAMHVASLELIEALKVSGNAVSELTQINHEKTFVKKISHFFFEGLFVPLGAAMFSLLAFYIATAAYRSFRFRSMEAVVMMVLAIIVMLGQIPHGPLYVSPYLPNIRDWLLKYLNTPAFRAIFFGSAIAGLAMAVRMWLSLEKSPLSNEYQGDDGDCEN